MGLLDSILRGGLGGGGRGLPMGAGGKAPVLMALLPIVLQLLANRQRGAGASAGGGLGGLLEGFRRKGYGAQADSWVGTGANAALPPDAVDEVLGPEEIDGIAAQAGVSRDEAREGLSQLLPEVVDRLTPAGQLPDDEQLRYGVEDFERQLRG